MNVHYKYTPLYHLSCYVSSWTVYKMWCIICICTCVCFCVLFITVSCFVLHPHEWIRTCCNKKRFPLQGRPNNVLRESMWKRPEAKQCVHWGKHLRESPQHSPWVIIKQVHFCVTQHNCGEVYSVAPGLQAQRVDFEVLGDKNNPAEKSTA